MSDTERSGTDARLLAEVRRSLTVEACALRACSDRIGKPYVDAIETLASTDKLIVCSGVGKSGHVASKMAATFSSTGMPAVYLNAAEASHGDLGVVARGSVAVLISNSGSTPELLYIIPVLRRRLGCTLIGILGNVHSPLAARTDIVLDASVSCEADCLDTVPTASAVVAMAIGDALASAIMLQRQFTRDDYLLFHPGGQLGTSLSLTARDIMRTGEDIPVVRTDTDLVGTLSMISEKRLGATCVVGDCGQLVGLVTDGDVRRHIEACHGVPAHAVAESMMNPKPLTARASMSVRDLTALMGERPGRPVSLVPVLDDAGVLLGVVSYYDVFRNEE